MDSSCITARQHRTVPATGSGSAPETGWKLNGLARLLLERLTAG